MNQSLFVIRNSLRGLLGLLISGAIGCTSATDPVAQEDVSSNEQALGESSCATAEPNASFEGGVDFSIDTESHAFTPYSNPACYKSLLIDVKNYALEFSQQDGIENAGTDVAWADFDASNRAECEGQYVRAVLYEYRDGPGIANGYFKLNDLIATGVWTDPPTGPFPPGTLIQPSGCTAPDVFFGQLHGGRRYRFAVTARSSGVTRKLTVQSLVGFRDPT